MIHHYTSIENLALILESGKIRFNRLDKVDDIEEYKNIEPRVFVSYYVSCWTEDKQESIPLWKMYTPNMTGVRISVPKVMFKQKKVSIGKYDRAEVYYNLFSPFSLEELITDNYVILNTPALKKENEVLDFYNNVVYEDYDLKENRNLINPNDGSIQRHYEHPGSFGFHKKPIWEFQKESRFKIMTMPNTKQVTLFSHQGEALFKTNPPKFRDLNMNIEFIDLDLDEKIIDNIEITLGPVCSLGDKIIVESLLKTFTNNGKLKISNQTGKIRKK